MFGADPARRRVVQLSATVVAATALLVPLTATPAGAALSAVSPRVNPATGYALWYEDANGLRLEPCLQGPSCVPAGGATLPDPNAPAAVPGNYPFESFYFRGTAVMTNIGGAKAGKATLTLGVEGSFAATVTTPTAGQQITFGRIGLHVSGGLVPGATYTVTEPYGTHTAVADSLGGIPNNSKGLRLQTG